MRYLHFEARKHLGNAYKLLYTTTLELVICRPVSICPLIIPPPDKILKIARFQFALPGPAVKKLKQVPLTGSMKLNLKLWHLPLF